MCARYSLTQEQITILIGEIEVVINIGARGDAVQFSFRPADGCHRAALRRAASPFASWILGFGGFQANWQVCG
jgi:hypothetical protein